MEFGVLADWWPGIDRMVIQMVMRYQRIKFLFTLLSTSTICLVSVAQYTPLQVYSARSSEARSILQYHQL